MGLLGAYFMLRVKSARKYGLFWLTLWLVYTLGRASLGFVSGNPDAIAYFMLAYASIAVLAAFAAGVLLSALAEAVPGRPRLAPALGVGLALLATASGRALSRSNIARGLRRYRCLRRRVTPQAARALGRAPPQSADDLSILGR